MSKSKSSKKYAVVSYWKGKYGETRIWSCDSEMEAIEKMQRLWEKAFNFALGDELFDEGRCYHEDLKAEIVWTAEICRIFEVIRVSEDDEI